VRGNDAWLTDAWLVRSTGVTWGERRGVVLVEAPRRCTRGRVCLTCDHNDGLMNGYADHRVRASESGGTEKKSGVGRRVCRDYEDGPTQRRDRYEPPPSDERRGKDHGGDHDRANAIGCSESAWQPNGLVSEHGNTPRLLPPAHPYG
jgi:hypothetical protein